ncbi:MAG: tyrosine-type recombinase/integrase [Acetobacteraceae bacterium]
MRGLRQAIGAIDPAADVSRLKALCGRLKHRAVPRRQKHLRIVDPAILIDKALSHYEVRVRSSKSPATRDITHARDALMLAFVAYHPIRLANFAGLRLGQHVVERSDGFHLSLSAAETKERRPYECPVADDLLFYLRHYLEYVRPWLLDGESSEFLWVSMRGSALSASAIYYQINKITKRLIGHAINPHLIRDCVLTALAEHAPESVRAGALLLGHGDLRTGEMYYNHASAFSAQRIHFELIRALRRNAVGKQGGT